MHAITVRQPWAWAIINGGKDVENRTRNIVGAYRGLVAVHAAKDFAENEAAAWAEVCRAHREATHGHMLPAFPEAQPGASVRGRVIGVAEIVDVHTADDDLYAECHGQAPACDSPWAMAGHTHIVLANPRPLARAVPARGFLGLWTLPDDVEAAVLEQLGGAA